MDEPQCPGLAFDQCADRREMVVTDDQVALPVATCRQEAVRLAKRSVAPDAQLAYNRKALGSALAEVAPELCELPGVGSVVAASMLAAWSHPGRGAMKRRSPLWRAPV